MTCFVHDSESSTLLETSCDVLELEQRHCQGFRQLVEAYQLQAEARSSPITSEAFLIAPAPSHSNSSMCLSDNIAEASLAFSLSWQGFLELRDLLKAVHSVCPVLLARFMFFLVLNKYHKEHRNVMFCLHALIFFLVLSKYHKEHRKVLFCLRVFLSGAEQVP